MQKQNTGKGRQTTTSSWQRRVVGSFSMGRMKARGFNAETDEQDHKTERRGAEKRKKWIIMEPGQVTIVICERN